MKKKQKTGGEWLDHFQSQIREYCKKQQISLVHRVQMISILSKAWSKAFELGYMEQRELGLANKPTFKFVLNCEKCGKSYVSDFAFPKDQLCDKCLRKKQNDTAELFSTK
jgi:hypothetical protein